MLSASCGPALRLVIWLSAVLSASSAAFAADQPPTVPLAALFIAQIVLLLLVGRLLGEAMQRIGQPAVMGQLIAGVILAARFGRRVSTRSFPVDMSKRRCSKQSPISAS
jgi:hypothetical protein